MMMVAGFAAERTLKELYSAEEDARHQYLARDQVLTTLSFLVRRYDTEIERYLFSAVAVSEPAAAAEMARQSAAAHSAMKSYPGGRDDAERLLVDDMERQLREEESTVQRVLGWSPQERRRRGPEVLSQELIPRRLKILETLQQIAILNLQRLNEASLSAEFSTLRTRLTRMVFLASTAGLLLYLLSALYIVRLERQARRRYADLARSRRDLEELSGRLVDAQETERKSLSRELHDEVGQSLGALLVDVGRLSSIMPPDSAQVREQLGRIKTVAENAVNTVRNMALLLRPSMLDDLGLLPALEWQGREVSRRTQMEVEVQAHGLSENLPDEHKICIYRVVQEALNNAARHASAPTAKVTLAQDSEKIHVSIADRGSGFDARRVLGLGLLGMEERVKRLGGSLTIESSPGRGTTVSAELPLGKTAPPQKP
jgi:signal transduction histidine kinase